MCLLDYFILCFQRLFFQLETVIMLERQETYSVQVVGNAFSYMEACSCLLLHYEMSVMQVRIAFQVCITDIFTQHFYSFF